MLQVKARLEPLEGLLDAPALVVKVAESAGVRSGIRTRSQPWPSLSAQVALSKCRYGSTGCPAQDVKVEARVCYSGTHIGTCAAACIVLNPGR